MKKSTFFSSFTVLILLLTGFFLGRVTLPERQHGRPLSTPETFLSIQPGQFIETECIKVTDGDTIRIKGGERVRYFGINAPELMGKTIGLEREIGTKAYEYNKKLVEGKKLRLEFDPEGDLRDRFGRLMSYVWLEETLVNEELLRRGLAEVLPERKFKYQKEFLEAQEQAQKEKLGIWSDKL